MPVYDQQYRPGRAGRTTPELDVGASEICLRRPAQPRRLFSQVAHDCRPLRVSSIVRSCGVQLARTGCCCAEVLLQYALRSTRRWHLEAFQGNVQTLRSHESGFARGLQSGYHPCSDPCCAR